MTDPTPAAMRAAEKLYEVSIISGCTPEIVAQYIDGTTGLPELIDACEKTKDIIDKQWSLLGCHDLELHDDDVSHALAKAKGTSSEPEV